MRQIKAILLFFIFFNILHAQPSPEKSYLNLNFCIEGLTFISNDSTSFYSSNKKIKLSVYKVTNDEYLAKEKIKLSDDFQNNFYIFTNLNEYFNLKIIKSIFYNEQLLSTKKIFIEIEKNKSKMQLYFDFPASNHDITINNLKISFKKGVFKIIGSENPKLIEVKN